MSDAKDKAPGASRRSFFARMFAPAAAVVAGGAIAQAINPSDDEIAPEERHRRAIEEMTKAEFEMLAARGPETDHAREMLQIADERARVIGLEER